MNGGNILMRKKKQKKLKKYKVNLIGTIATIIIFIICIFSYFGFSYYLNIDAISVDVADRNMQQIATIETIRDVLLVILTICGTNFLLSVFIEVRSRNAFLTEIINNDIIACPEFYNGMSDENKEKIYSALEQHLNYGLPGDIFSNIKGKINNLMEDYFFESCEYVITCDVHDDYIEKEITKVVSIKSFKDKDTIKDFCVGNHSAKTIAGKDSFELLSVEISKESSENTIDVDIKTQIEKIPCKTSKLDKRNEYDKSESYVYKRPLIIHNNQSTFITVKCITRTTTDDKVSTFRVTKPCKNFILNYSLNQTDKYRLSVDAFGFLDDADNSTNNSSTSNVNIHFKDWIFKYDGVVVSILDKINIE